jgi:tRNA pseudouridine38-40 synthase
MRRFRLILEYDGTDFHGWQIQNDARTVEGVLEETLTKVTQETPRVIGAGRTDAGVHARAQVAHVDLESRMRPLELRSALNTVLPPDLAIPQLVETRPDFHARHDATGKRYVYRVLNTPVRSALRARHTWHRRSRLDLDAMRTAATPLLGEHDFAAFRGAPGGAPPTETTVRTLERLDVTRHADEVHFTVEGRSFLRYMVRNLVGTLIQVGHGRRPPDEPAAILLAGDRTAAGPTAPAHGLVLEAVHYRD